MAVPESWIYREPSSGSVSSNSSGMSFGDFAGFGTMLASFMDTAVSSSDRKAANELNYWAQMDVNKTNAQINADQLAWAKELYRLQKAENRFLVDQAYERELENRSYNSPQNMKELYLRAGINPYLASQVGSAGGSHGSVNPSVGSPPSGQVPGSIPMQAAHFEPTMPNGLGLSDAMLRSIVLMQQSERNQTDISAIRQRVANETAETKAKIASMGKKDKETDKIIEQLNQDILFNKDSYEERMRSIQLGNDKLKADVAYTAAETDAVEFANKIAPEVHDWNRQQFAANLKVAQAQAAEVYARKDLTDNEKELTVQRISEQTIRNSNLPKSLHNENAIQVATYNQIKNNGKKIAQETKNLEWEEKDLRKGYRQHSGNNRSLQDIMEVEVKRNPLKRK